MQTKARCYKRPQAHQDLLPPAKDLWHTKTCCYLSTTCNAQPLKEPWVACELGEAPPGLRAKQVLKKAMSYISDFVYNIQIIINQPHLLLFWDYLIIQRNQIQDMISILCSYIYCFICISTFYLYLYFLSISAPFIYICCDKLPPNKVFSWCIC